MNIRESGFYFHPSDKDPSLGASVVEKGTGLSWLPLHQFGKCFRLDGQRIFLIFRRDAI
jgi:hypothetical protein